MPPTVNADSQCACKTALTAGRSSKPTLALYQLTQAFEKGEIRICPTNDGMTKSPCDSFRKGLEANRKR